MNINRNSMWPPSGLRRWLTLLGLTGALASASLTAQAYELTDLGVDVVPKDINDLGIVVGTVESPLGPGTAFRWTDGVLEKINGGTVANGINYQGQITGNTLTGAFLYDGVFIDLGDGYTAGDINNNGGIAGSEAGVNPFRPSPLPINPAVYNNGQWDGPDIAQLYSRGTRDGVYADQFSLAGYNDLGFAVGKRIKAGIVGSQSIMMDPNLNVTYLLVPNGGRATAINNQGMIVGATGTNSRLDEYEQAYIYDGAVKLLGTLHGGLTSSALDINESNQVVGTSWLVTRPTSLVEPEKHHAFLWEFDAVTQMGVLTDLNDDPAVAGTGWILTAATAINNEGDIVGTGLYDADGDGQLEPHGFLLAANGTVPPPPPPVTEPPVAVASADPVTGPAKLTVTFDAAASADPDGGAIVAYAWDFGDGKSATGVQVTHTYKRAGVFTVTLTVTDDEGQTDTDQVTITVTKKNAGGRK